MRSRCRGGNLPPALSACKAAIFDMDGTLLNSMEIWHSLGLEYLRDRGLPVPPALEDHMALTCGYNAEVIAATYEACGSAQEVLAELYKRMAIHYATDVEIRPGARQLIDHLVSQGISCCLATATPAKMALPAIERFRLREGMRRIVCGDELGVGKGAPAYYERLAEMLGAAPDECLVFEDALYAIRSAKAAGCAVCAIEDITAYRVREEIVALSDLYICSFCELLPARFD